MIPAVAEEQLLRRRQLMIDAPENTRPFPRADLGVHEILWVVRGRRAIRERIVFERAERYRIHAVARDHVARKRIPNEAAAARTRRGGIVSLVLPEKVVKCGKPKRLTLRANGSKVDDSSEG
jgi:hypothetical protein